MDHVVLTTLRKVIHDNSSEILTGIGVLGTVTTAYLTGRACYTTAEMAMYEERRLDREQEPLTFTEKAKLSWKLYIPAVTSGTITVVSIVYANKIKSNQLAALTAAYAVSERSFNEYKDKVVEQIGPRKEEKIRDEIQQDRVNANPPDAAQLVIVDDGQVLCYEAYTGRYFHSNMDALRKAEIATNYTIINDLYATLTQFYDELGISKTSESDNLGWNTDKKFELIFSGVVTDDGKPCLAFEYNYIRGI